MIEIVYKEEKQEANGNEAFFHIPNNIRQIGDCKGNRKIYMEDYVYTYLRKLSREHGQEGKAAVLLGKYNWSEGKSYIFIRSAMEIPELEVCRERIAFSEDTWKGIHEEMRKYFETQDIVGWVLSMPEIDLEMNEVIRRTHLTHFAGNDKVLFAMEPLEQDEQFFAYENGTMVKEPGFYIYYEKNEPMQNYMIEKNQNKSIEQTEEVPDRAVAGFRKTITEKKEQVEEKTGGKFSPMLQAASACAVVAVLAVGASVVGNYGGLQRAAHFLERESHDQDAVLASSNGIKSTGSPETSRKPENPTVMPEATKAPEATVTPEITPSSVPEGTVKPTEAADVQTNAPVSVPGKYTVVRGDTLSKISERYYGTMQKVAEICVLNGIDEEDVIYEGQIILLP